VCQVNPNTVTGNLYGAFKYRQNRLATGAKAPDPAGGTYSAPLDSLASGESGSGLFGGLAAPSPKSPLPLSALRASAALLTHIIKSCVRHWTTFLVIASESDDLFSCRLLTTPMCTSFILCSFKKNKF